MSAAVTTAADSNIFTESIDDMNNTCADKPLQENLMKITWTGDINFPLPFYKLKCNMKKVYQNLMSKNKWLFQQLMTNSAKQIHNDNNSKKQ